MRVAFFVLFFVPVDGSFEGIIIEGLVTIGEEKCLTGEELDGRL